MRVALLFLLLSCPVWAQKSLSPEAFQVNVRPVLSGILNDFYQMITLFPDFPKEMIELVENMDELAKEKESLRQACPSSVDKKCLPAIDTLRSRLQSLELITYKLMARGKLGQALHIGLGGLRLIQEFQAELTEVKGAFDNTSFLIKAGIKDKREIYPVLKQLDQLNTLVSLGVVEHIPYNYREDFRHFYFNFVHPVQLNITKHKNYEFLNRNVNALNFSLNLLNMNLTKRNKKTPEGMGPYLATIHNRWNSLLRYYF